MYSYDLDAPQIDGPRPVLDARSQLTLIVHEHTHRPTSPSLHHPPPAVRGLGERYLSATRAEGQTVDGVLARGLEEPLGEVVPAVGRDGEEAVDTEIRWERFGAMRT
jgi:hypothetical protein